MASTIQSSTARTVCCKLHQTVIRRFYTQGEFKSGPEHGCRTCLLGANSQKSLQVRWSRKSESNRERGRVLNTKHLVMLNRPFNPNRYGKLLNGTVECPLLKSRCNICSQLPQQGSRVTGLCWLLLFYDLESLNSLPWERMWRDGWCAHLDDTV